ncbi:hypothetical protein [Methylobacterium sp. J-068]|uniref:hypothetical protein n=1 Tax=Methylobacterium sp. J-068 TaxID=2836649 RepID=UPI001FB883FC|nr:hypothetical protein [Methylobacterium sp. J-068]MCJ2034714.1 hypothetical protein [Methylobacterium sp. J-068]
MIFALGFLAASLFALLLLPAVNARAARLSQRRIEARLPLSISEVAAEKDYLRAQFAVAQRRLERKVEAVNAHRHADLAAIGARTLEAAALTRTVESRDATLSEREAVIAATRETLSSVERDLATARQDAALGIATLKVLEEAHRDVLDDLLAARDARMGPPMATGAGAPEAGDTVTGVPDLTATLVAERETLRASLAAAEEALAQLMVRREGEAADLRRRISDVADSLMQRERLPAATAFTVPAQPN